MYPVTEKGRQLTLREFREDDLDALLGIYGDPVATQNLSFAPRNRDQVAAIIRRSMESATTEPRVEYALAAVENATGRLIGTWRLAYAPMSAAPPSTVGELGDTAQFGCALAADVWRRGFGVEGTRLLLELAFGQLGLHTVWGARGPENNASAALMHRLGFVDVEIFRDHITKNGVPRDSIAAKVSRDDWHAVLAAEHRDC